MAIENEADLVDLLKKDSPLGPFTPYCYLSDEADALTVYFEDVADYSERLNEHVTLFRSLETKELVGCRIKGIKDIVEDAPNYIHVHHDGIHLEALFFSFRGSAVDENSREALRNLATTARQKKMVLQG